METVKRILLMIIFAAFIVMLITFPSCKEIQYVPVHEVDTIFVDNYIRDSIKEKDSVYIFNSNETLYVYREKVLYRDKIVVDTIKTIKYEEIPVEVEKVVNVEVEKKHPIRDFLSIIGAVVIVILAGLALYRLKIK